MNIHEKLNLDPDILFKMGVLFAQLYGKYTHGGPTEPPVFNPTITIDENGHVTAAIDKFEYGYPCKYDALIADPAVQMYDNSSVKVVRETRITRGNVTYLVKLTAIAPIPKEDIDFLAAAGVVKVHSNTYDTISCSL